METPAIAPDAGKGLRAALAAAGLAFALAGCAPTDPEVDAERHWEACETYGAFPEHRLDACSVAIASDRLSPERRSLALINRGVLRAELGQHARAIADFGRALRIDPRNASAYFERGVVHHNRGALENAVRDYDRALALQPGMPAALERRDQALAGREQGYLYLIARLDDALSRDRFNPQLLNGRCWTRAINDDDLDMALTDCNEALRIQPRMAAALDSRGLVHLKRGEFALAVADYDAALVVEPATAHYLYGRGLAKLRLGMETEGRADLDAAVQLDARVTELYSSYGEL